MIYGDGFLCEDTQNRLSILRAKLSVKRGEKLSLDEIVGILLERDRMRVELSSWLYTGKRKSSVRWQSLIVLHQTSSNVGGWLVAPAQCVLRSITVLAGSL